MAVAGGNACLANLLEAPEGSGRRKHALAQWFGSTKGLWQAKMDSCAVLSKRQVLLAGESTCLRSISEAPSGSCRQGGTPAHCCQSARWLWQARTHACIKLPNAKSSSQTKRHTHAQCFRTSKARKSANPLGRRTAITEYIYIIIS